MKKIILMTAILLLLIWCSVSYAENFVSGSTGALGAFNPTVDTEVTLPPDGKLNYTTVNIPATVTVTFKNLPSYNSPVYMLATGDVVIDGTVDVSGTQATSTDIGLGGPGGFAGGYGGGIHTDGGKGLGPGGGNPGRYSRGDGGGGGFGTIGIDGWTVDPDHGDGGPVYGNAKLLPLIGGSGGGGGAGNAVDPGGIGGGAGGAILIASSGSITVTGSILAQGKKGSNRGADWGGSGSGGAIKLVANNFYGNGTLSARGGLPPGGYNSAGGYGRICIEAYNNYRTASTDPPYSFGLPGSIFMANEPSLTMTSIGGMAIPANPTGNYNQPDIFLDYSTILSPVAVDVSATNIPVGTSVKVWVLPQYGDASSSTATLSGTQESSSCTTYVTLSENYAKIIMAEATFTVQQAMYYDGEKIEKVRIAANMAGKSETTYITESGREIKGELFAGLVR